MDRNSRKILFSTNFPIGFPHLDFQEDFHIDFPRALFNLTALSWVLILFPQLAKECIKWNKISDNILNNFNIITSQKELSCMGEKLRELDGTDGRMFNSDKSNQWNWS